MRFVACHKCKRVVQIGGDLEEIHYLLGSTTNFPCITPLCQGRMEMCSPFENMPSGPAYRLSELPVRAFFRAIHGFGAGTGDPASLKRLNQLLLTQRVVDLVAEPTGQPERVILRQLILEGGARIHLETSAKGACVYYIEEPGPSCLEVVENEFSAESNPQGDNPDREEAGRATQVESEACLRQAGDSANSDAARASELPKSGSLPSMSEAGNLSPDDL